MAAEVHDNGNYNKSTTVKFKPTSIDIHSVSDGRNLSRENSLKTPTTPVAGFSGIAGAGPGQTPRDDQDLQHEKKKIGHRRVDKQTGEITYKKFPTSEICGAIQLGITNSIGSLASKPTRDLLMQDFTVVDTVFFPKDGTNQAPSHPYGDFRFKSYAPIAFRYFRALFSIKPEDFLSSLSEPLRELSNPGASGSIFYISLDDQFIIKTVQHKEAEFLQKLLPGYYMNLNQNPRTLLPKFFGLYCYQSLGKNVRLLVMNNLLPSSIRLHHKFDLKGSTYKRRASKYERAKESPTLKDLDFLEEYPDGISLEAPTYDALMKTVSRDCRVLESFKIMDYSLLVGIHNIDQSLRENDAESGDQVDGTTAPPVSESGIQLTMVPDTRPPVPKPDPSQRRVTRQKTIFSTWESIQTEAAPVDLDEDYPTGGIPARNARGDRLLLFIGVIDILQSYQLFKKMEHTLKSILHDGDTISVHRPSFYAQRFQDFMKAYVFKKTKSPFKHSPTKKQKQRRGTAGSIITDERHHKPSISVSEVPAAVSARDPGQILTASTAATADSVSAHNYNIAADVSSRPGISGSSSATSANAAAATAGSSTYRKLTFDTPRGVILRTDANEGNSSARETKRLERLFATSSGGDRDRKDSATLDDSGRHRILSLESDKSLKDVIPPYETNL